MMPSGQIEIQWPFKGLNEADAFVRQRGGQNGTYTTAKCENVVGFDPATGRNRGAARGGTRKYCPDRIDGASAGQCLVAWVGNISNDVRVTGSGSNPASDTRLTESGEVRLLASGTPSTYQARTTRLIGIAGGVAALITPSGVESINDPTDGFSKLRSAIFGKAFFRNIHFCDGDSYKYYDIDANELLDWAATTAGTMPFLEDNPQDVTAATNASPIVVTVTSHGLTDGDVVTIASVGGNTAANGTWTIDNATADTFELVGSTGNGAYTSGGTCVKVTGTRCSLISVWGGRIVLSGLESDPNNIFMSAVGDPFDFDYSPATQTVQQAVAGSFTDGFGKNPDIVTALIPYTDDVLLVGGSHSIRKILGNPAEGGLNVSVTDIVGIAYGEAWCQSPEGIVYFFGSRGGVYKIEPQNGIPTRLTALTIDERLADIDLDTNVVTLTWDDRAIAVRVTISPTDGSDTTHYVWDVRNEAWWPFAYANASHNPLAVYLLAGNTSDERCVLEYGQDGYVRQVDADADTDDGEPIESYVYLGPFSQVLLTEISAILSEHGNPVTWSVCSASSLEKALEVKPRSSGRFSGGRNSHAWPRAFIEEGYLRLSATGPWALEKITASMEAFGATMRRVMRTQP